MIEHENSIQALLILIAGPSETYATAPGWWWLSLLLNDGRVDDWSSHQNPMGDFCLSLLWENSWLNIPFALQIQVILVLASSHVLASLWSPTSSTSQ